MAFLSVRGLENQFMLLANLNLIVFVKFKFANLKKYDIRCHVLY